MTERAMALHATADRQIAELIELVSTVDEVTLRRPCAGREKLGDGTVAEVARHTADNYQRIASFLHTTDRMSAAHAPDHRGGDRIPRFLRPLGHGPADHAGPPETGQHDDQHTAGTVDPGALVKQLAAARDILGHIAELTDGQLDVIAPKDSFRFCNGQRTLEQVLASLLKHQNHQLDALRSATP